MANLTTPLVRKTDRKLYTEIEESRLFKMEGGSKQDLAQAKIFSLAVAQGFADGCYEETSKGEGTIFYGRWSYITEGQPDVYTFLQAIAVAHKNNIKVLTDLSSEDGDKIRVFEIAEAYANGGIRKLHHNVLSPDEPDFDKKMESILNAYNKS